MEFIPYKANECFEHLYYQIPMELFFNKNYKDKLSSDSKVLYGFLLNRLTLSAKNNWIDIDGNIYLIFTRKEVQKLLNLSDKTATKAFKQLKECKLIYEKRQGSTKPNLIKDYNEFIKILQDLDYIITEKNDTLSIRREPYKRNTRIERQFGSQYSKENIYKRILETQPKSPYSPEPYLLINRTYENYNNKKQKCLQFKGSISYLIYHYEKLLGINTEIVSKRNIMKMTPELIQAIKKMDEFSKQVRFVCKNNINTEQELLDYQRSAYEKINPLKSERENLWRKHKRVKTNEEKQTIENEIIKISKQITPLVEEIKYCNNIRKRIEEIRRFEIHQKLEQQQKKSEYQIVNSKKIIVDSDEQKSYTLMHFFLLNCLKS